MAVGILATAMTSGTWAEIRFQDVSAASGLDMAARTYGSSWGDFNGDGLPDLLIGLHEPLPRLYVNNGDGTFSERLRDVWPGAATGDAHGAASGDFDNDGDQDVLIVTGAANGTGSSDNHLLVNHSGTFVDEAALRGLAYPLGRGRSPLWLDWNQDGLLDAFEATEERTGANSELFLQGPTSFAALGLSSMLAGQNNHFAQLRDLSGDHKPELIVHRDRNYPGLVLELGANPPHNVAPALGLPLTSRVFDAIIEDLDGDLDNDLFLMRAWHAAPEAVQTSDRVVEAFIPAIASERGFDFTTNGNLVVEAGPTWYISPGDIYIGTSGRHPSGRRFTATTSDVGIMPHTPGADHAVYIGYDPTLRVWRLRTSSATWTTQEFRLTSTLSATNLQTVGFAPGVFYEPDRLLVRTGTGYVDRTVQAGFGLPTGCQSGAAGDFDNDMDLDLYLVCRSQVHNPPDILYENLGDGTFQSVPDAGGAAGRPEGRGNDVAVADFDRDGFLDLFVTNGWGPPLLADDGRFELFRNQGNDNHWVGIDLRGTASNRDAIGATILLTAGGKTQMREKGGGTHNHAQNDALIHFGLGDNDVVDEVTIYWPSGTVQTVTNVPANFVHRIEEPFDDGGPDPDGAPVYNGSVDKGIFLWREPGDSWRLRAVGGGDAERFIGTLDSNVAFLAVIPRAYEASDLLDTTDPTLVGFRMTMSNGYQDGIDFVPGNGADVCFDVALPAGATVWIGAERTPVPPPFNLADFGPCP
jgi:hypothetical protein